MDVLEPVKFHMYYKEGCPYSIRAETLLNNKGVGFIKDTSLDMLALKKKYGESATFPRIYYEKVLIGGSDELVQMFD